MAYVTFDNLPVYASAPNSAGSDTISDVNQRKISATQVQFNYAPAISNVPLLGKKSDVDNLLAAGPPDVSISFSALLEENDATTKEFNPFDYTGNKTEGVGCRLSIGHPSSGIVVDKCFLTNLSLSVTPYAPIQYNADFVCYGVPNQATAPLGTSNGTIQSADGEASLLTNLIQEGSITGVAHGIYSSFDAHHIPQASNFEAINYTHSATYTPVYKVGSFEPDVHFTSATQTLQVQADDIAGITAVTGLSFTGTLVLKNSSNTIKSISFDANLNGESASVTAGDVARASLNIVQPLK
jgi:hypothetical protein